MRILKKTFMGLLQDPRIRTKDGIDSRRVNPEKLKESIRVPATLRGTPVYKSRKEMEN